MFLKPRTSQHYEEISPGYFSKSLEIAKIIFDNLGKKLKSDIKKGSFLFHFWHFVVCSPKISELIPIYCHSAQTHPNSGKQIILKGGGL